VGRFLLVAMRQRALHEVCGVAAKA